MKGEAAAHPEKEQLKQQMATMKREMLDRHVKEKITMEEKLTEANDACGRLEEEHSRLQVKNGRPRSRS